MKTKETFTYELLIIADSDNDEITAVKSLLMGLSYSEKLWKKAEVKPHSIEDKQLDVALQVQKVESNENAFILNLSFGNQVKGFDFFSNLIDHLKEKLGFSDVKILSDGVTDKVAEEAYPLIREVEAAAKSHLQKANIKNHGLNWWEEMASSELKNTVQSRKEDLPEHLNLVESDFSFTNYTDLNSFVKEAFPSNFYSDWQTLANLRAKVLNNAFLTLSDLEETTTLCKSLLNSIHSADSKLGNTLKAGKESSRPVKASSSVKKEPIKKEPVAAKQNIVEPIAEKAIVQEKPVQEEKAPQPVAQVKEEVKAPEPVVEIKKEAPAPEPEPIAAPEPKKVVVEEEDDFDAFKMITEDKLIEELKNYEAGINGFVDLKQFVNEVLGKKGYMTSPTFSLAKSMSNSGKITIYDAKDERGSTVMAVKTQ